MKLVLSTSNLMKGGAVIRRPTTEKSNVELINALRSNFQASQQLDTTNTTSASTGKDLADVKVTPTPFQWTSPSTTTTDTCCISSKPSPPDQRQSRYVLVTPGRDMLAAMIDRRLGVRSSGGDSQRFRALDVPSLELIEYAQGLMLSGYLGEEFMYVVEWEGR